MKKATQITLQNQKVTINCTVLSWTSDFNQPVHITLNYAGREMLLKFSSPTNMTKFYNDKKPAFVTDQHTNDQWLMGWKK